VFVNAFEVGGIEGEEGAKARDDTLLFGDGVGAEQSFVSDVLIERRVLKEQERTGVLFTLRRNLLPCMRL